MTETVDVVITIRAEVPVGFLAHVIDKAREAAPIDGILSIEIDGTNRENGSRDAVV